MEVGRQLLCPRVRRMQRTVQGHGTTHRHISPVKEKSVGISPFHRLYHMRPLLDRSHNFQGPCRENRNAVTKTAQVTRFCSECLENADCLAAGPTITARARKLGYSSFTGIYRVGAEIHSFIRTASIYMNSELLRPCLPLASL